MTQLVRDGLAGWSPSRHLLFHPGVRSTVRTVLMVSSRVRNRHTVMAALVANLLPWERQMLGTMPTGRLARRALARDSIAGAVAFAG